MLYAVQIETDGHGNDAHVQWKLNGGNDVRIGFTRTDWYEFLTAHRNLNNFKNSI